MDRGSFGVEVMIALLCYKIAKPKMLFLNRGNHESRELNLMYGFEGEVVSKYCSDTFLLFTELFKKLPLAHLVDKRIFVVHGGLTQNRDLMIEDIQKINRKQEIPKNGIMNDLLWSDPFDGNGFTNNPWGCSVQFGKDVVR